jgi:hypothetical protein
VYTFLRAAWLGVTAAAFASRVLAVAFSPLAAAACASCLMRSGTPFTGEK